MGKTHIVLTFYIGTQSTRALLISSEGQILAKAQKGYQHMCRVARQLKESYPEEFRQIEAATLTTIRCTGVCLGDDGNIETSILEIAL